MRTCDTSNADGPNAAHACANGKCLKLCGTYLTTGTCLRGTGTCLRDTGKCLAATGMGQALSLLIFCTLIRMIRFSPTSMCDKCGGINVTVFLPVSAASLHPLRPHRRLHLLRPHQRPHLPRPLLGRLYHQEKLQHKDLDEDVLAEILDEDVLAEILVVEDFLGV